MPRSKAQPTRNDLKRPREPAEDEEGIDPAIVAKVVEGAEAAEISKVKERIASGECAAHQEGDAWPHGLVRFGALGAESLAVFSALHTLICDRLGAHLTGWGGVGDKSGRLRGYGYMPNSAIAAAHYAESHVMKEYVGHETETQDRDANRRASVLLTAADLPEGLEAALERLLAVLRPAVDPKYRPVLVPSNLVAAQPNLHRGKAYLRPHLDEPLHDGFGVVIVTIAIAGGASILIRAGPSGEGAAAGALKECCFPLARGEAYALSGEARNTCLHGVLADDASATRESLNLRFGLHAKDAGAELAAWDEVQRHWPSER